MKILVTGGSSDIGQSIVKRRLALGDEVIVTASSESGLANTLAHYRNQGLQVKGFTFDLSMPEQSGPALDNILAQGIDAVVLNACTRTPPLHRFHTMAFEKVKQVIDANVLGNCWLLQAVLPTMMKRGFGRIVFVSSVSAINGTGRYAGYVMAKSAIEGLMLNLAVDYGEFNILSNTVRLGIFKTARNKKYWSKEWYREKMSAIIPQNSLGEPEHVGEAFDPLLASNQYINGSVLTISGGFPMVRLEGVVKA